MLYFFISVKDINVSEREKFKLSKHKTALFILMSHRLWWVQMRIFMYKYKVQTQKNVEYVKKHWLYKQIQTQINVEYVKKHWYILCYLRRWDPLGAAYDARHVWHVLHLVRGLLGLLVDVV